MKRISVSRLPEVVGFVQAVLQNAPLYTQQIQQSSAYYRLLAAEIVTGQENGRIAFRCALYRDYLQNHWL